MSFRERLHERAASVGARVVLAEGWDARVRAAAAMIESLGIATVSLLESPVSAHPRVAHVAEWLQRRKPDRVRDAGHARELASDSLRLASGLVALGEADAAVAGATCPTAEVMRAALWAVGAAPGIETVSSAFYMIVGGEVDVLTFTDGGVVPDPTAGQLVEIASAAARDRDLIVGDEPRVGFLSYSTKGSASGCRVEKVREASASFSRLMPKILSDGELQADAALVPEVANIKAPDSPLSGLANVLVFPDLDSGNIAYKLVQRLAGAGAVGPILQGLAKPVADLSRGATVEDIVDVVAVAALQSAQPPGTLEEV
jgi:phosphate acetyltransferase